MAMNKDTVPGVVIHHVPAATRNYIGSPSIVVLPSGEYVASHDYFGIGAANTDSFVYRSSDRGQSWERTADIPGQVWSKLFWHEGSLYIFGADHCDRYGGRLNGKMVIRKSDDAGDTWTDVTGPHQGLIVGEDGYHTAPTPLVVHNGRIWKGFEFSSEPDRKTWRVFVLSAPVDANLLDRDSWTFSEQIDTWTDYQWIEGNMVISPNGEVVDILRTNDKTRKREGYLEEDEPVAVVHVSEDGTKLSHNKDQDLVPFPGGGAKFTIKRDTQSSNYYALVNPQNSPELYRNVLSLTMSTDLKSWKIVKELIRHPEPTYHAFQYVDWDFDGDDIVYASRTAYDDGLGGANRAHDANYMTFDRVERFREYT